MTSAQSPKTMPSLPKEQMPRKQGWEILWKLNQIAVPLLLGWGIWVTSEQFKDQNHRNDRHAKSPYEKEEALELEIRMLNKINDSSKATDKKIDTIAKGIQDNAVKLSRIEALLEERNNG